MKVKWKVIIGISLVISMMIPQTVSAKTTMKLSVSAKTMKVGQTYKLTVKKVSKRAKIKWKNQKKSVVRIVKTGNKYVKFKAVKEGTAIITAKYKGQTKKCRIIVKSNATPEQQAENPVMNATDVTLYYLSEEEKEYIPRDKSHLNQFQFKVLGTKRKVDSWKVIGDGADYFQISEDGYLTVLWGPPFESRCQSATVVATLSNGSKITSKVRVYSESNLYAEQKMAAFENQYITSDMTQKEKVEKAAWYIGMTTEYQTAQNSWKKLLFAGKGDCYASRILLAYMCQHMGIKAQACSNFEYHGETFVKADGHYYIVTTGFDEPKPRRYMITVITEQSQIEKIMSDNKLYPVMFE